VVPKLGGASLAVAKFVLPLVGCKVGKVKHAKSKRVAKGDVISTSPGAGSYPVGKRITLTVSSG
jgi:beta-lactam-binding protein with PASTA domain